MNYIARTYQSLGIKKRRELIAERNVQIQEWINTHPDQTRKEIASLFNVTAKTVGEIERKMKQNHVSCPPVEKPNKIKKSNPQKLTILNGLRDGLKHTNLMEPKQPVQRILGLI